MESPTPLQPLSLKAITSKLVCSLLFLCDHLLPSHVNEILLWKSLVENTGDDHLIALVGRHLCYLATKIAEEIAALSLAHWSDQDERYMKAFAQRMDRFYQTRAISPECDGAYEIVEGFNTYVGIFCGEDISFTRQWVYETFNKESRRMERQEFLHCVEKTLAVIFYEFWSVYTGLVFEGKLSPSERLTQTQYNWVMDRLNESDTPGLHVTGGEDANSDLGELHASTKELCKLLLLIFASVETCREKGDRAQEFQARFMDVYASYVTVVTSYYEVLSEKHPQVLDDCMILLASFSNACLPYLYPWHFLRYGVEGKALHRLAQSCVEVSKYVFADLLPEVSIPANVENLQTTYDVLLALCWPMRTFAFLVVSRTQVPQEPPPAVQPPQQQRPWRSKWLQ